MIRVSNSAFLRRRHSGTPAQSTARFSDLDLMRDETPKLLEMARSPASALPARPSALHRCASSRHCRNCGLTGSRRPGGRRTLGRVRTLVGRRSHPGCHRPGGRLIFIEHVRSDDAHTAKMQDRMNPLNRFVVCCDCNRPTLETVRSAGFAVTELQQTELPKAAPFARPLIIGTATAPAA